MTSPGPAKQVAPFGAWPSPVTPASLAAAAASVGDVAGVEGRVVWAESRPAEAGRVALVRLDPDGADPGDVAPPPWSARTRVHEYGGGAWVPVGGAHPGVVAVSWADQRIWWHPEVGVPRPLTPEPEGPAARRYADLRVVPGRPWLVAVRESHVGPGEARNDLVAVAFDPAAHPSDEPGDPVVLADGADFYAAPRPGPDGRRLCWVQWDHPNLPWDTTALWLADLVGDDEPALGEPVLVAGGDDESVLQPGWAPDGSLLFCSDRTGWWNVWRRGVDGGVEPAALVAGDVATPAWVFDMARWCVLDDGSVLVAYSADGVDHLGLASAHDPAVQPLEARVGDTPVTSVASLRAWGGAAGRPAGAVAVVGSPVTDPVPAALVVDPATSRVEVRPLRAVPSDDLGPEWCSVPRHVAVPATGCHALLYPPASPTHDGPPDGRPPLLVLIHGGPTAAARPHRQPIVQFWTSRGFAVADVNYRGSTGYGRAYREALHGRWGVADVEDCVATARHLADTGVVDGTRLAIRGGSAGGLTVLLALALHDVFAAGCSMYGVTDLAALARDTHKFEARYLDSLVGPLPGSADVYRERSPLTHAGRISAPLLVLQGLEDEVVPPSQSEAVVAALQARGVPVRYLAFEGEQHGFRRAETVEAALEAELAFYRRHLRLDAAEGT